MDSTMEVGSSSVENKPECGLIPAEHIPVIWPRIAEILDEQKPEWLDRMDPNDLLVTLYAGKYDLWAGAHNRVIDGFILCQWEVFPKVRYYHVGAVVGRHMRKYIPWGLKRVEQYAALRGAKEVTIDGRMDLQAMFHRWGYYPKAVTLRKDVRVLWSN